MLSEIPPKPFKFDFEVFDWRQTGIAVVNLGGWWGGDGEGLRLGDTVCILYSGRCVKKFGCKGYYPLICLRVD